MGTRREVTLVFQEDAVYDHLDVGENLEFPFRVTSRVGGRHIGATADRFLIRALLGRASTELSAGQRHVVAAARALVRPEVEMVLLDEPMVGTDPHRRRLLVEALLADPGPHGRHLDQRSGRRDALDGPDRGPGRRTGWRRWERRSTSIAVRSRSRSPR
jgi:ABC-type transport system involved in cytochrome c biogenesis ATPase subunit